MYPPCLVAQLPKAATASDPPVRLTYRESLLLFHMFFLAYNSRGGELDSEPPSAAAPLGEPLWAPAAELRRWSPQRPHDDPTSANKPGGPI
jgi:hypothetical protein